MPSAWELSVASALIVGTFFTAVSCLGLLRLPDVFCRMHAAGKAGTLGVCLTILAATVFFWSLDWTVVLRGTLAIWFQLLTTPAATHLLARASYLTDYPLTERTAVDELRTFLPSRPDETHGHE
jgi:multicomponent Na+:H+ antiporter subunit G